MILGIKNDFDNNFSLGMNNSSFKSKQKTSFKVNDKLDNQINKLSKDIGYYAKKGEPIYDKEMDSDSDGIITFDEFKEYCENNDVDSEKLLKNWLVFRTVQNEEKVTKEITKNLNNKEDNNHDKSEIVYAKKGDEKYDEKMDANNDNIITYKEYIEYCSRSANQQENDEKQAKLDTNTKKALDKYVELNSKQADGMVEIEA